MNIHYNVTGAERKALATALGEILNQPVIYRGTPTFSYEIGEHIIDRGGTMVLPQNASYEEVQPIVAALKERGYEGTVDGEPNFYEQHLIEIDTEQAACIDAALEESMREVADPNTRLLTHEEVFRPLRKQFQYDVPEPDADDSNKLVIEIPLDGFTDKAIENLGKIVASKNQLIKKALGVDSLHIDIADGKLSFPWFILTGADGEMDAYLRFITAICKMAKNQKRVSAKERPLENDKFTMRLFLIRLGFVGSEFKAARKILLKNLTGNTAWKDGQRPERRVDEL